MKRTSCLPRQQTKKTLPCGVSRSPQWSPPPTPFFCTFFKPGSNCRDKVSALGHNHITSQHDKAGEVLSGIILTLHFLNCCLNLTTLLHHIEADQSRASSDVSHQKVLVQVGLAHNPSQMAFILCDRLLRTLPRVFLLKPTSTPTPKFT